MTRGQEKVLLQSLFPLYLGWKKQWLRKTIEPKSLSFERLSGLLLNQNLPKEYITDATEIEFCGKAYTISLSDKTVKVIALLVIQVIIFALR